MGLPLHWRSRGDSSESQRLAKDLETRFPEDTAVRFSYVPSLGALLALKQGEPAKAVELLQIAVPYDLGTPLCSAPPGFFGMFYPVYVRGMAYLAAHQGVVEISGYYASQAGEVRMGAAILPPRAPHLRAGYRIARTFQTPRLIGGASVLDNVMIGGTIDGQGSFAESLLTLPRHRRDEKQLREAALLALAAVGLEQLAAVRADRLQHSELRFMEIARALKVTGVSAMIEPGANPFSNAAE